MVADGGAEKGSVGEPLVLVMNGAYKVIRREPWKRDRPSINKSNEDAQCGRRLLDYFPNGCSVGGAGLGDEDDWIGSMLWQKSGVGC